MILEAEAWPRQNAVSPEWAIAEDRSSINQIQGLFMKIASVLALMVILLLPCGVRADSHGAGKIRIVFEQQEAVVEIFASPAGRDFMSLLPLTLDFKDYAGVEKIANLPRRLVTDGSPSPREMTGDFTYYAPWGNLAVFYQGFGSDGQLIVLGRIMSGKDALARMTKGFTARIEKIEP
jgi:hypothetical protein